MKIENIHIVYFIGIGGIGMSALARWFKNLGVKVHGYDRTRTALTDQLAGEGIEIHFTDDTALIPGEVIAAGQTGCVVYTPAIPDNHSEFNYLKSLDITVLKRSEVLGMISETAFTVAVAGTHGKTTTSAIITHLLKHAHRKVTALLGGISTNYESNFITNELGTGELIMVLEADEFDRSFLRLHPDYAVVTSMDADHLDVYGNSRNVEISFNEFVDKAGPDGRVLINDNLTDRIARRENLYTYGLADGGCHAENIRIEKGIFMFDYVDMEISIRDIQLHQPGFHNVENAVAAIKVCLDSGLKGDEIKQGLATYKGVKRRFEFVINTSKLVYVDDYAHHPVEIEACLGSLRALYPSKRLTAIFQPHLYSRTRDFAAGFGSSLSVADEILLLDIYPAREEPIPGVTSELIFEHIETDNKRLLSREKVLPALDREKLEVLATLGAGDIDQLVEPIKQKLTA
ncbi:MAG: UDP-N-acetylmuramate--L-alanine ligase [Bacteroidetes bacterium]|nr:UDP-N-acetylmuramate--L-alanine ligase [Bacteroidota bacterium]